MVREKQEKEKGEREITDAPRRLDIFNSFLGIHLEPYDFLFLPDFSETLQEITFSLLTFCNPMLILRLNIN